MDSGAQIMKKTITRYMLKPDFEQEIVMQTGTQILRVDLLQTKPWIKPPTVPFAKTIDAHLSDIFEVSFLATYTCIAGTPSFETRKFVMVETYGRVDDNAIYIGSVTLPSSAEVHIFERFKNGEV